MAVVKTKNQTVRAYLMMARKVRHSVGFYVEFGFW
jgi:hypothetical protein